MTIPQPLKKRKTGFSMAEMMIALFILSIGILGVVGMFFYISKSINYSGNYSKAINYARQILDDIRADQALNLYAANCGLPQFSTPINSSSNRVSTYSPQFSGDPNAAKFYREIIASRLSSTGWESQIAQITVRVYWLEREWKHVELVAYYRQI